MCSPAVTGFHRNLRPGLLDLKIQILQPAVGVSLAFHRHRLGHEYVKLGIRGRFDADGALAGIDF